MSTKTYAEVIAHEAKIMRDLYLNGSNSYHAPTSSKVIGFIYGVEERDVDIDIDEEFQQLLVDTQGS